MQQQLPTQNHNPQQGTYHMTHSDWLPVMPLNHMLHFDWLLVILQYHMVHSD
jgi:hypothetical protein